jgi:hypothetical protein
MIKPLAEKIAGFESIEIWDTLPHIVSRATALELVGDDTMEAIDSDSDPVAIDAASLLVEAAYEKYERTETMRLHFGKEELYWSFFPKHTTVQCETVQVPHRGLL